MNKVDLLMWTLPCVSLVEVYNARSILALSANKCKLEIRLRPIIIIINIIIIHTTLNKPASNVNISNKFVGNNVKVDLHH